MDSIRLIYLEKGGHRFHFLFDDTSQESIGALLKRIGQYASDPNLPLNWHDAAKLLKRIPKVAKPVSSDA